MTGTRHRAPTSAPLSTKIAVGLGLALVVAGFALAGWQQLTADDEPQTAPSATQSALQYLPSVETVVGYAAVVATAVIAGGYVFVRARRRQGH